MINMQIHDSFSKYSIVRNGENYEIKVTKPENLGDELLKMEKEADSKYDTWNSYIGEQHKISKAQFRSSNGPDFDPRKLQLNESEKTGINGISEATGFSRTAVHTFYALSVKSGLVNSINEFVTKMVGEPTQRYSHLKNRLTENEGAKILSTLV